jgi:hypothetical protein
MFNLWLSMAPIRPHGNFLSGELPWEDRWRPARILKTLLDMEWPSQRIAFIRTCNGLLIGFYEGRRFTGFQRSGPEPMKGS